MKNKCILVTGATRGIGWAISTRLADEGAHVIGISRNIDEIDFPGHLYQCDLSEAGQTEEVLRIIREKYPVDAIVNNVGLINPETLGSVELLSLYKVLDLNIRTAVQSVQVFVEGMKHRREGKIINIASVLSRGAIGNTSYAAAKAGLIGCTKTWALELAPYGITVNAISPGPIDTATFAAKASKKERQEAINSVPMSRLGRPEEVASLVSFLLSDDANYITGQDIAIDGGKSI